MANSKITQLTALTTPIRTDIIPIVDDPGGTPVTKKMELTYLPGWIYPNDSRWVGTAGAPLTSTSFDGDSFSTTAKTLIDLSAVFGVPAGVKSVLTRIAVQDSGAAANDCYIVLGPTNTAAAGMTTNCVPVNDRFNRAAVEVPCDANGDIYYQIVASGASTFDVFIQIWGYCT